MKLLFISRPFSAKSKKEAIRELLENTLPDRDFYVLVIGAILLSASGILIDSIPVLIASMIVAPLAYPILGLGLGVLSGDARLAGRCMTMLLIAMVLAILVGGLFSLFARSHFAIAERTLISFFPNVFFDLFIAILSGAIAAYGLVRSKVGTAMTGIGIAVSLMPPLVATGIGLFDPASDLALRALIIFVFNVAGILAGSLISFAGLGIHKEYRTGVGEKK